jgi:hypothetical protein
MAIRGSKDGSYVPGYPKKTSQGQGKHSKYSPKSRNKSIRKLTRGQGT